METQSNRPLAEVLGNLAVEMQSQHSSESVLHAIVAGAIDLVPGTSCAGISRVSGRNVTSEMPSDPIAAELDQLQTQLGEGPALSAHRRHQTVFIKDLSEETRWPNFVATATRLGVHCLLSFRLFVIGESLGVLNLYGAAPEAFTQDSVDIGEIFAQHAAVAMAGAAAVEQMKSAVATRDVIGQAKGILMHRDNLTGLQAFATLARASQETNVRLVDVARWLVNEHESKLSTLRPPPGGRESAGR
jgi:GAF domain-containing protein